MKKYKVLGLMSGTSLDGLDLAYCHLWQSNGNWEFSIENTRDVPYTEKMRDYLKNAIHLSEEDHDQFCCNSDHHLRSDGGFYVLCAEKFPVFSPT